MSSSLQCRQFYSSRLYNCSKYHLLSLSLSLSLSILSSHFISQQSPFYFLIVLVERNCKILCIYMFYCDVNIFKFSFYKCRHQNFHDVFTAIQLIMIKYLGSNSFPIDVVSTVDNQ